MRLYPIDTKFQRDGQKAIKKRSNSRIHKPKPYDQKSGKGISSQFICYSQLLVEFLLNLKHVVYLIIDSQFGFRRTPIFVD